MVSRDLSNTRIQMWLGPLSALADYRYATEAQLGAMLMAAPAIRWDGLDFGMQASEQIDDRSLDDDATATLRGFLQFGGGVPLFFPKVSDQTSVVRNVFNLVKVRGTELALVERVGFVDRKTPGTAGDNINIYKVMTDGYQPDTEGTGGYAYLQSLIPRGDVAPWSIVQAATPAKVGIKGGLTASLTASAPLALRGATLLGNDITPRAIWSSSNPAVATVDNRGIIERRSNGTANVTAMFPGGTISDPIVVTAAA